MATTAGGEKLYAEAPDERAVLFYKNYTQLAEASDADRPALADVYEQLLDSIAGASVLYKSRAAEVGRWRVCVAGSGGPCADPS
jgi:hypothetical protein